MHRNVEVLIGRLATDLGFQKRFAQRPFEALREQGLELSEIEIAALVATDSEALRAFTAALDTRLRKVSPSTEARYVGGETQTESPSDSGKETRS